MYIEAAHRLRHAEWLERASAIVRWVKEAMVDAARGGFFNAASSGRKDRTMYVDKNAMMVGAFIRAAALFDDVWLRDFALKSLEAVIVPAYAPGDGVAHVIGDGGHHDVRNLLTDQIHVASALIWAHAATGQLPYSMLAAEVVQFAVRTMWDEDAASFRDRVETEDPLVPFELNCHAACVLDRLSVLTGDARSSGPRPRYPAVTRGGISRAGHLWCAVCARRAGGLRSSTAGWPRAESGRLATREDWGLGLGIRDWGLGTGD